MWLRARPAILNGDTMVVSNSGLVAILLPACFGVVCPAALTAGVDAKSMVDAEVRCAFPVILAKAVREHARQEMTGELNDAIEGIKTWAGPERPLSYRWCAIDLNGDGKLEVIYYSGICGVGGCASQVLAWRGAKLTSIGTIGISHDGPMIGKRRHRGWRDLYIFQKGSASSFSILVYTFRRGAYREAAIPLLFSELNDRSIDPDGITIDRDRNAFRIGENIPEADHGKRLRGYRGWHPSHWKGGDPGYSDEVYEKKN
jgi:hypothetical protein